jgi:O-antigen/teichoic acid export membrane protein
MKRHGKNFLALFGSDALVRLFGFAAMASMARAIDPSAFGTINFGLAVLSYGVLFSSPGLHIIGALKIADRTVPARSLVRMISSMRFVLASVFCLSAGAVYILHPSSGFASAAFLFSWTLIPISLQLEWYFQGREILTITALGKIIASGVFAGAMIVALNSGNASWIIPLSYGAGLALQTLFLVAAYSRLRTEPDTVPVKTHYSWRMLMKQALPVGSAVIAAQALLNFPLIALGIFSTAVDIAHFSAAAKLVFFALAIDRVMYSIFFPFIARTHARDPLSLPMHLERIAKYIFLFCIPVCISGSILAPHILTLVYGAPYAAASLLLQIQLWYFFLTILNSLFSYPLIALGHERYYGTMTSIIAISTIVLILPLTYYFTSAGASAGLVIGELMLVLVMGWKARTLFHARSFSHIIKPLAASFVMGCFLVIFSYISLFLIIPAGALVYAGAAYGMKAFDAGDLHFFKEQFV